MKLIRNIPLLSVLALIILIAGCDKKKPYATDVSAPRAHFIGNKTQVYSVVNNPAPADTLQIGTTDVSSADRLVTFTITSTTGAVAGTHYTINGGNTVTIPGGKALASFIVQADYSQYSSGRVDTLILAITTPSLEPAAFLDTLKLIIAGPSSCSEADPDFASDLGAYANTNELLGTSPYGPYTTSIASITPAGPTTATMVVQNIWDNGWSPLSFTLDWSNPASPSVEVIQENNIPGSDAGDLNPTYAGMPIAVRPYATSGPGNYSACNQDFTLNMQLGVGDGAGGVLGYFNVLYQVHMQR